MFGSTAMAQKRQHFLQVKLIFLKIESNVVDEDHRYMVQAASAFAKIEEMSQKCQHEIFPFSRQEKELTLRVDPTQEEDGQHHTDKNMTIVVKKIRGQGQVEQEFEKKQINLAQLLGQGPTLLSFEFTCNEKPQKAILHFQINVQKQDEAEKNLEIEETSMKVFDEAGRSQINSSMKDIFSESEKYIQRTKLTEQSFAINLLSVPLDKKQNENEAKQSTASRNSQTSGQSIQRQRIKDKFRLRLNVKKSLEQPRKLSIDFEIGDDNVEERTPFPKGISFESKNSLQDLFEISSSKTTIKSIIQDVKEKQWEQDSRKPIQQEFPEREQSPLARKDTKNGNSQSTEGSSQSQDLKRQIRQLKKENQNYKKQLIKKDCLIDNLSCSVKTIAQRQQQKERVIRILKQELAQKSEQMLQMKYRQAYLMQELLQTSNEDALQGAVRFLSV